jgi:hypothetical protein
MPGDAATAKFYIADLQGSEAVFEGKKCTGNIRGQYDNVL